MYSNSCPGNMQSGAMPQYGNAGGGNAMMPNQMQNQQMMRCNQNGNFQGQGAGFCQPHAQSCDCRTVQAPNIMQPNGQMNPSVASAMNSMGGGGQCGMGSNFPRPGNQLMQGGACQQNQQQQQQQQRMMQQLLGMQQQQQQQGGNQYGNNMFPNAQRNMNPNSFAGQGQQSFNMGYNAQ